MAQASSIQREPSMEEILASIRRIIEDNDTDDKAGSPEPAGTQPAETSGEVANFRAEMKPDADEAVEQVANRQPARESPPTLRSFEWPHQKHEPVREDEIAPGNEVVAEPRVDDDVLMDPVDGKDLQPRTGPEPLQASTDEENAASSNEDGQSATTGNAAEAQTDMVRELRPSILSQTSGRQVAAAFQELNKALEANRRKSLDQMAEEMLRPMLQDWLDNNLPRMVEKLVREEIERIARGS